ncbi:hypothetical protein BMF94_1825 [Rhodotorula taiwanensis]|uniref:Uncharacterized protein n=1 Tax=Rhodotorula taiwanensis TaxID=741276 RepID=A0A2S5BEM1_9BASI|nr:hypothetical protein BMF94_1825 [Rhodotorula taiwanensis]
MFRNKHTQEMGLPGGLLHVLPWRTAICGVLLAISTFWGWAVSQNLLPGYMKVPALVGGAFCSVSAISCLVAHFFLAKGETHWDKDKHLNATNRDSHRHPLTKWPHALVFWTTIIALLTEGSYIYMVACVLFDDKEQYW